MYIFIFVIILMIFFFLQSPAISSGLPFLSSSVMGDVCGPEATYITNEVNLFKFSHLTEI